MGLPGCQTPTTASRKKGPQCQLQAVPAPGAILVPYLSPEGDRWHVEMKNTGGSSQICDSGQGCCTGKCGTQDPSASYLLPQGHRADEEALTGPHREVWRGHLVRSRDLQPRGAASLGCPVSKS